LCGGILSPTGVQVLSHLDCSKNDVDVLLEKTGFSREEGEKFSLYMLVSLSEGMKNIRSSSVKSFQFFPVSWLT